MRKREISKWDNETEVLVAGYGFAGAVAAIEAHDAGAKVLLIEKEAHPAGCSPTAGGITLFITEGLMHPDFNIYKSVPGSYIPTWVELSSITGAVAMLVLWFAVVAKVVPVIEVEDEREG